jgi:hypothetical protein
MAIQAHTKIQTEADTEQFNLKNLRDWPRSCDLLKIISRCQRHGNTCDSKRFNLEARVGIEHQSVTFANLRNSQQYKPLRSFLNVFNGLTRGTQLQGLFWKGMLLLLARPQSITALLFYWSFYWRQFPLRGMGGIRA